MFNPHEEILPEDVSEEDRERILKRVAAEIVSRRLTAPAIFFLESCSPLSFVGSQGMIVLEPFIHAIFNLPDYRRFALIMERRENVNRLITMIEIANQEQKATGKKEQKKRRWLGRRKK
ncbi:hypothetical protein ACFL6S_04980 [Candidatus Poribacteria bacterium]